MVTSVIQAFDKFSKEIVNIDKAKSDKAKLSRDWLIDNVNRFPLNDNTFPLLYGECHLNYGSFERKTKTRPLDDIDLMICLNADGWCYSSSIFDEYILLHAPSDYYGRLNNYRGLGEYDKNYLNSTRILNAFKSSLNQISQYEKAEIKRNNVAITLQLSSYEWNFDIVPCFRTTVDDSGRSYYLIPDGQGNWKKTDPRIDRARVQRINQSCNGNVLNVIRLFKYWNQNLHSHSLPSYLLEAMICDYYQTQIDYGKQNDTSKYLDWEFINVLKYLINNVYNVVKDPKNIDGNINDIDTLHQFYFKSIVEKELEKAEIAYTHENNNQIEKSIKKWQEVFGENFPKYG